MENYVLVMYGNQFVPLSDWEAAIFPVESFALHCEEESYHSARQFRCMPEKMKGMTNSRGNMLKLKNYLGYLRMKNLILDI
jgi:hypothetical protein